jgi:hypothetical protein
MQVKEQYKTTDKKSRMNSLEIEGRSQLPFVRCYSTKAVTIRSQTLLHIHLYLNRHDLPAVAAMFGTQLAISFQKYV